MFSAMYSCALVDARKLSSTLQEILQYLENYPSPISKKYSHLFGKYSDLDLRFGRFVMHNSETTQKSYVI